MLERHILYCITLYEFDVFWKFGSSWYASSIIIIIMILTIDILYNTSVCDSLMHDDDVNAMLWC